MSKLLCLRGTNAYCPCRFCLIQGERDQTKRPGKKDRTTYYPALQVPRRLGQRRDDGWDPNNLPVCTYNTHVAHITEIRDAEPNFREKLGMYYGINRLSRLLRLKSLRLPDSFPHNIMHLFFENICPLLREHWTGSGHFKNVEPADPGYRLAPHIWEQVGC
jgi:hypothetical protein